MNVLSLCDGMSCLQIAMKELGMKVDKYYASEIDKHAIKQTQLNFHNTIQLGSITEVDVSKLDRIDFIGGGTPCTNFSFAGKRQGMSTKLPTKKQLSDLKELKEAGWRINAGDFLCPVSERVEIHTLERYLELKEQGFEFEGESYLFWEYMRILRDVQKYNPDVIFLLENVEMGKKWERILSSAVGLFGVHINSALVSAQNRKRIYWTNIRTKQEGLFGEVHTDIPQPEDRGILLRDILEDDVDEKYYLSGKMIAGIIAHKQRHKDKGNGFGANIDNPLHKDNAILSRTYKDGKENLICVAMRGREDGKQHIEPQLSGKTNSVTTVQKDNLIYQRARGNNKGGMYESKSPTLSANAWEQNNILSQASCIRRLTPTEVSRLQTIPDWYRWECSDTQIYKMCGNGWTVEVIKHILSFMK